jgi:diphthamide synthase (EF-2-diphthine--ammonia ligase)
MGHHLKKYIIYEQMDEKVLLTWSGGKDSAMALYIIQMIHGYEVSALLTTVTKDYDRVSMHDVRRILVKQQAESLNLPLEKVLITKNASNDENDLKSR